VYGKTPIDASEISSDLPEIVRVEALLALLVLTATPLSPRTAIADADGDGVPDAADNCSELSNADQADRDLNGFGNVCDADCTGDDFVGGPDFAALSLEWGLTGCSVASCACDFNDDGAVGGPDFFLLSQQYGGPVGPSGLACAGTTPCTSATPPNAPTISPASNTTTSILGTISPCIDDGLPNPPALCTQDLSAYPLGTTCSGECDCTQSPVSQVTATGGSWEIGGLQAETTYTLYGSNFDGLFQRCSPGAPAQTAALQTADIQVALINVGFTLACRVGFPLFCDCFPILSNNEINPGEETGWPQGTWALFRPHYEQIGPEIATIDCTSAEERLAGTDFVQPKDTLNWHNFFWLDIQTSSRDVGALVTGKLDGIYFDVSSGEPVQQSFDMVPPPIGVVAGAASHNYLANGLRVYIIGAFFDEFGEVDPNDPVNGFRAISLLDAAVFDHIPAGLEPQTVVWGSTSMLGERGQPIWGDSGACFAFSSPPSFDDPSGPIPGLGTHEIFGHALAEWFHTSAFPDPPGTVYIGDGGSGLRGFGITAIPPGFQTRAEVCSRALAKPFVE
jgi:hypothetical protein